MFFFAFCVGFCISIKIILIYHIFDFFTILYHEQGHWSFLKNNGSKICIRPPKKSVLSYSASHKYSASNSTRPSILLRLDHKHITANQNKNNISNIDDIQSCNATKTNWIVQVTCTSTHMMGFCISIKNYPHLSYFWLFLLFCTMSKDIGRF